MVIWVSINFSSSSSYSAVLKSVLTSLFQYKANISSIGEMVNYNFRTLDLAIGPRPKIESKVRVFKFKFGYYSQLILNFELNWNIIFYVGPPKEDIFPVYYLSPIFRLSLHIAFRGLCLLLEAAQVSCLLFCGPESSSLSLSANVQGVHHKPKGPAFCYIIN